MKQVEVPTYYKPRPYQQASWIRRNSGKYAYYFKVWARQAGKDTDDLQWMLKRAWDNPGTQSVYVGLNNVWVNNNIFKKYIDGRKHWQDYPDHLINVRDTQREVTMLNNPKSLAEARIKFIGFQNDQQLIGSSYDVFAISEASLYGKGAFDFITPIWDRKLAEDKSLMVAFNGTPRGIKNVLYDMLTTYTGKDDPADFPGEHMEVRGGCYVDVVTNRDLVIPDGKGGWKPMYTEEDIEQEKAKYLRQFGNMNFYSQEHECNFTTVNSGLVYLAIEVLLKENRYTPYNINPNYPVFLSCDIGSKRRQDSKQTHPDASAFIVFQHYNGMTFIFDYHETWGLPFSQSLAEIRAKGYWQYIKHAVLPWDAEVSSTMQSQAEECRQLYPEINWHVLSKDGVEKGINYARALFPNLIINSKNCERLLDCFLNYEYQRKEKNGVWSFTPVHNWASHGMDAFRYMAVGVEEVNYLHFDRDLDNAPSTYGEEEGNPYAHLPVTMYKHQQSLYEEATEYDI